MDQSRADSGEYLLALELVQLRHMLLEIKPRLVARSGHVVVVVVRVMFSKSSCPRNSSEVRVNFPPRLGPWSGRCHPASLQETRLTCELGIFKSSILYTHSICLLFEWGLFLEVTRTY